MADDTSPNLRDLQKRAQGLAAGHPSSPCGEDGSLRPREPSLADLERPEPPLTDAEWADHVQLVTDRLDKARAKGLATEALYTLNPDHDIWNDERTQCHDEILADLYAEAASVPAERKAIMAGGLGGAGKTTVLDLHPGTDRTQYLTINPDRFKEELAKHGLLPDIPGLSPMEVSALAHKESSYLARRLALRAMADGKNLIWDITMSSAQTTASRIDALSDAGYQQIGAIFVDIPVEVSVARADARHRHGHDRHLAGEGLGGRHVPSEVIRAQADPDHGSVNRRAFETLKHSFSDLRIYDNSVDSRSAVRMQSSADNPRSAEKEPVG